MFERVKLNSFFLNFNLMKNESNNLRHNCIRVGLGIISAACLFILAACGFNSPMTNEPSGPIDEKLLGAWVNSGGETTKISKSDNYHYLIERGKNKFSAYQSDIGNEHFITLQNDVQYLFLHYTVDVDSKKLTGKNVSYNLLNETSDAKTIRKVIENSLSNPKLYDSSEFVLKKTDAGEQSGNVSQNAANNSAPTIKSGRFNSKDAVIYYEIYGAEKSGTPLFVLHGGPGFDHLYFLSNSAFTDLAKIRPVVFYDQRGTGKSAKLTEENAATVKNNVEDLENLRKFLGYNKIDVAGHSWGGFLAMAYSVFFQDNVSHLIIIDSMPSNYNDDFSTFEKDFPNENAEMNRKKAESIANNLDPAAMRASTVAYMKMLFYSTQNRDRFITGSTNYTFNPMVFGTISYSAQGLNITPELANLTNPVLIIHGRYDSNINVASAEKIHNAIAKSKLVIFEQSGHMPFYEEKDKFVLTVEKFLGGRSAEEAADYDFNRTTSGSGRVTSEDGTPNDCANIKNSDFAKSSKCANDALDNLKERISVDDLIKAMNMYIISFPVGRFDILKTEDIAFLQRAAGLIQKLPSSVIIEVSAYTDNVGFSVSNQALSENRAKAVKAVLVALGVKESVLRAKGYGDSKPIASNNTDDGRFQNRRIEYSVLSK